MILRTTVLSTLVLVSCGTPCARIAAAEAAGDQKGAACNASRNAWSDSKLQTCERNQPDCTENDLKQFDLCTKCIEALPTCAEGQRSSWELSRSACGLENLAFKVNLKCVRDL